MLAHTSFLRASSEALNINLDITAVATGAPPPLPGGAELAALVEAITTRTAYDPQAERDALGAAIGERATERAIGVCGTFQMMNRLLDGVGAPVAKSLHPLAKELGFEPADIPR